MSVVCYPIAPAAVNGRRGPTHLSIADTAMGVIRNHAQRAAPNECCGLLIGEIDRLAARILIARPCANVEAVRPSSIFVVDPDEVLRGLYTRDHGGLLLGFYHSHPDGDSSPSRRDIQDAWPGYVFVIASRNRDKEWHLRAGRWPLSAKHPDSCVHPVESRRGFSGHHRRLTSPTLSHSPLDGRGA